MRRHRNVTGHATKRWFERQSTLALLAGVALVGFLGYLLVGNYLSSRSLRQASAGRWRANVERNSATLEHFFSRRRDDLNNIALSREITGYFENKALGMSLRYGLRQSLIPLQKRFWRLIERNRLEQHPIYTRLVLLDAEGEPLIDTAAVGRTPAIPRDWRPLAGRDWHKGRVLVDDSVVAVSLAYRFKGDYAGQLIAFLDPDIFVGAPPAVGVDHFWVFHQREGNLAPLPGATPPIDRRIPLLWRETQPAEVESSGRRLLILGSPVAETPLWVVDMRPSAEIYGSVSPRQQALGLGCLALLITLATAFMLRLNLRVGLHAQEVQHKNALLEQEIAERRDVEKKLRRAKDAAVTASRAKSEFLAKMSHEIRTPMNGVIGMLELIGRGGMDPRRRKFLETAGHSAQSLLSVINDILDFSKVEAGRMELEHRDFALRAEVLDEVAELFAHPARKKGLDLIFQLPDELPEHLRGDPGRLRQILTNLLANAIKFTERGGVTLRVEMRQTDDASVKLRFDVADTGVGIRQEQLEKVFDSFDQGENSVSRRFSGTGLGLAISKQLVGLMGGEIGVESEPGTGSDFWFHVTLERCAERKADANGMNVKRVERPSFPRGLRVLLAEDNPVNQLVAEEMLASLGCRSTIVEDGKKAVVSLERGDFDLVLMDCQMPELDGYQATAAWRRQERETGGRRLPIIAVTASALNGDRERAVAAGMDDYLSKPYTRNDLRTLLEKWGSCAVEAGYYKQAG